MIRTALKHYVYEVCIDVLFNTIFQNFKHPDLFKVGEKYTLITLEQTDRIIKLEGCFISAADPSEIHVYVDEYSEFDKETELITSRFSASGIRWAVILDEIVDVVR